MIRRLFLFLTALLYHQFAWAYDWIAALVSAGHWKSWTLSILPDLKGPHILELGHGPGHLQSALRQKGIISIGLDKSLQMSKQAYRRLNGQCQFVHGDALHLPFADETFDQVVATFPTNYIVKEQTLAEVFRVLRPGGGLVVVPGARLSAPSGVAERFASGIFRLFHLSPDWTELADNWFVVPIEQAGFEVRVERRVIESSEIFIIHGKKPNGNSNRRFQNS
ncbi:MAG TPA: methyltransferase domain-containing protein [Anaerolineales bacterium]|nr:methyltransferase domain-containing protein [Anaerolineales bacterium]